MVLDIRDVAHGVAYLEIDFVGTVEHVVEDLLQFLIYLLTTMTYLGKEVTVALGLETTFAPGLTVQEIFVDISLNDGILNLW